MPEQHYLFKDCPLVRGRRIQPFFLCKGALVEKLDQNGAVFKNSKAGVKEGCRMAMDKIWVLLVCHHKNLKK